MEDCFANAFIRHFPSNLDCSFKEGVDFQELESIISSEDNLFLCKEINMEEVKTAVFDLAPDKSPGSDGFPPFFFRIYWSLVGS